MLSHKLNSIHSHHNCGGRISNQNLFVNPAAAKVASLVLASSLLLLLLACFGSASNSFAQTRQAADETIIPGEYIVVLKQTDRETRARITGAFAETRLAQYNGQLLYLYDNALGGFAAKLSPAAVEALRKDPLVDYIEPNRKIKVEPVKETPAGTDQNQRIAFPPILLPAIPWNLDRIDQHFLPLNGSYTFTHTGAGVRVYIIDTGIRVNHAQFGGRAVDGYDAIDGSLPAYDCNGHGTHVAATVGGATYGVAKGVELVAVRVLDCGGTGSYAGVIAGVNWVTGQRMLNQWIPAIANMSLGGGAYLPLDAAVKDSIEVGVTYSVAAGNDYGADACQKSPARVDTAITVGATNQSDQAAGFSNTGSCLSLFAPGVGILSAWHTSDTATNTISGTSMAAPHVAGVAALYLQAHHDASPATVKSVIMNQATRDVVINAGFNSSNLLLYSLVNPTIHIPLSYEANVATQGWQIPVSSPSVAGTIGQSLQMEALKLFIPSAPSGMNIHYRAHVAYQGWQPWLSNGQVAGTIGLNRQMEAVQIVLTGAPPTCKVRYRAHVAGLGWLPWMENGQVAGTTGQSRRMEALQVICTCQ